MSESFTGELIAACLEGSTDRVIPLITNHVELDVAVFVKGVFAAAIEAIETYVRYTDVYDYIWWILPMFPEIEKNVITSIELVLRAYDKLVSSREAGSMLIYSCCTHINLVPVILELFKDRLDPRSIIHGIDACAEYYPETRWSIMREYMSRFTGKTIYECFNICCWRQNLTMLELVIDHHALELEAAHKENMDNRIAIDDGIWACCHDGDIEAIQLLATRCKFLGPRLLGACVYYQDLEAARLVISECREYLTIEKVSDTGSVQQTVSPRIMEGFDRAVHREDTDMLELLVTELGDSLSIESKEDAFMVSFSLSDVLFARTMLKLCSQDLMFEGGLERAADEDKVTEAMWELLNELYGDRLIDTDAGWSIAPID